MDLLGRLRKYEPLWENWYIDDYIGEGTFSVVYKIKNSALSIEGEYGALKIIPITIENETSGNYESRINLIEEKKNNAVKEIQIMMQLKKSPYIVDCKNYAIKEVFDDDGIKIGYDILIQMDYYQCFSKKLSKMTSILSEDEIIKLALHIGNGLKDAHDSNIIHRDIKPDNIFIDNEGNYLLGDLGVSKQCDIYSTSKSTTTGTPPYMAPEIYKKASYNKTVDIYSFGLTLYQLLNNNCLPFTNSESNANDIENAIYRRLDGEPFAPPATGSSKLKQVVMKACQYNSTDRYQDINDMINDFKDISTGENIELYNVYKTMYAGDNLSSFASNGQGQKNQYNTNGYVMRANSQVQAYEKNVPINEYAPVKQKTNPFLVVMLTIAICLLVVLIIAILWMFVLNNDDKDEKANEPAVIVSSVAEESSVTETTTQTTTTTKKTTTKKKTTTAPKPIVKSTDLLYPDRIFATENPMEGDIYINESGYPVKVYYGPDTNKFDVSFTIDSGTYETLRQQSQKNGSGTKRRPEWLFVSTTDGRQGWVKRNDVKEIIETPSMISPYLATEYDNIGIVKNDVNFRMGPHRYRDPVDSSMEYIKKGEYVQIQSIYSYVDEGKGKTWVYITYSSNNGKTLEGWVCADSGSKTYVEF